VKYSYFGLVLAVMACSACDGSFRIVRPEPSADGKTYLSVTNDIGCKVVRVDGVVWSFDQLTPVAITPGTHELSCDEWKGSVPFAVDEGTTFTISTAFAPGLR